MEILQTIWTAITAENEKLISIFLIPLGFVEAAITMLLFSTILNFKSTTKNKILYVVIVSVISLLTTNFIVAPYNVFLNLIIKIVLIILFFKTTILKAIVAEIIPFITFVSIESIVFKIYLLIFNVPFDNVMLIPIHRIPAILAIYLIVFCLYKLAKHFNFSIKLLDNMDKKSKLILTINAILGIISIATQATLNTYYSDNLPLLITILSTISLLTYFIISIYSLTRTTQLQLATQNLEEEKLYNKTLNLLHDNIRGFKHDFNNIVSAIGGYVSTEDMEGLKSYYTELLKDCKKVNNLTVLSPSVINNSAIYSLLTSKYHQALEDGIQMDIDVFMDLNTLNMKIYEFTRIFGILLDNALEASKDCDTKLVRVTIRKDSSSNRQLCIIENTYKDKSIDTEKIFEKGFSTKNRNSGIGLWEIRQILKKLSNVNLYTSKTDDIFKQQLEIYI